MNATPHAPNTRPLDRVSGPHGSGELQVYLLHGADICPERRFDALSEALAHKTALVHETGTVGELEVENLSPDHDLLILAGEVVKGGRQDRTLGVDLVVPARSGRVKVPAYCVEQRRWHRRKDEAANTFSASTSSLPKDMMLAAKLSKSQQAVWARVSKTGDELQGILGESVASPESPSSYQLMTEHHRLRARQQGAREGLDALLEGSPDAVGFAFVIGGRVSTADVFASPRIARQHYGKLLDAAIVTALSESRRGHPPGKGSASPGAEALRGWLEAVAAGEVREVQDVPPRLRIQQRHSRSPRAACFGSVDGALGVCLHQNWASLDDDGPVAA